MSILWTLLIFLQFCFVYLFLFALYNKNFPVQKLFVERIYLNSEFYGKENRIAPQILWRWKTQDSEENDLFRFNSNFMKFKCALEKLEKID